jgi:hypothetical protein
MLEKIGIMAMGITTITFAAFLIVFMITISTDLIKGHIVPNWRVINQTSVCESKG